MSRPGIPAFDAGHAFAMGRTDQLRRALDKVIEPKSALAERLSDVGIGLLVKQLDDVRDDFVDGVIAGARSTGALTEEKRE